MCYTPRIVSGRVKDTGWPIDGHLLYFSQWDYDKYESFHLYGWDDRAVFFASLWRRTSTAT